MNILEVVRLMEKYKACIECGSEIVGNRKGSIEVGNGLFKRTCKCGWSIEVREDDSSE